MYQSGPPNQEDARSSSRKVEKDTSSPAVREQAPDMSRLNVATECLNNEVARGQVAVTNLQTKLNEAHEIIQKQKDALKQLLTQRDEFVKKLKTAVKKRIELVNKCSELLCQIKQNRSSDVGVKDEPL